MRRTDVLAAVAGSTMAIAAWAGGPDQDRAYAAELKADAANKSSALESSGGLSAADGDSKVVLGGFTQFRYYLNFRDDPGDGGAFHDSGFTNGFEATRTRLQATGNVMSKDFTFKVEGEFDASGNFSLLDAFAAWSFDGGSTVLMGQFLDPLWREWGNSPKGELGADFSVATAVYNPGYTQGVAYNYRNDQFNVLAVFDDGFRSGNTPYTTPGAPAAAGEADWGLTGRFEFKGGGDWNMFNDFSGWRGQETAWLLGLGAHFENDGNTASSGTSVQGTVSEVAFDGQVEGNGWNVYGCILWAHVDPASGSSNIDDFAGILQGGYMFTENMEGFLGWNGIFPDEDYGSGVDKDFHTALVGMNFYPFAKSSAVKFTTDLQWFFNKTTECAPVQALATSNNTVGLRPSGEDNQVAIRLQLQVSF